MASTCRTPCLTSHFAEPPGDGDAGGELGPDRQQEYFYLSASSLFVERVRVKPTGGHVRGLASAGRTPRRPRIANKQGAWPGPSGTSRDAQPTSPIYKRDGGDTARPAAPLAMIAAEAQLVKVGFRLGIALQVVRKLVEAYPQADSAVRPG